MASSTIAKTAPPLAPMEAKMIVATCHDHCQQLKDMVSKEDPSSMVVVLTSSHQTSAPPKPRSPPPLMDPRLLAVACTGSWKELQSFLNGDPRPTSGYVYRIVVRCCGYFRWRGIGSSAFQQPSRDEEAFLRESLLDGVTIGGDTFLHMMATNSVDDKLYEDGGLIHRKAVQFLFVQNNNGDTPLHCAARAAKSKMVSFLIDLARSNDANTVKALLETENNTRWTVLHEAVRVGNNDMVELLMREDSELASSPKDATSPMYLAILHKKKIIAETLHQKSGGVLSYSGPNGQNALHAAVF